LKQYSEAGEEFLEAARSRAVEFLRELARVGQSTQKQATDQVEDLMDAGRKSTDQVLDVIRKEISGQLGALGLATKEDLAALERKLTRSAGAAKKAPAKKAAPAAKKAGAPAKKAAAASTVAGKKTVAKKAAPAKASVASKSS
jgi:polyhydroxyalkanoate synthesis regulator phasin